MNPVDFWDEPISRYTSAQALADGVLVDATARAGIGTGPARI